ncbi:MAG: PIN domain-containing protein [Syntrophales bacterium]|nr:PIN domain-containing protein [Syntrophales bacterium]
MSKTKTFVDSNVLITAFQGIEEIWQKAMEVIDDPERDFIVSDYLKFEVIPQPTFHQRYEEIQFMETFLDNAAEYVRANDQITNEALTLACQYSLGAMDALHAGTAILSKADELITLEKPEKPLCQIKEIAVVSLRS